MSKKTVALTFVLLLGLVSSVADGRFIGTGLFNDPDHSCYTCAPEVVPCEWVCMDVAGSVCIIDATDAVNLRGLYVGCEGVWDGGTSIWTPAVNELYMTGGELLCEYLNVTRGPSDCGAFGYFEMSGGTAEVTGWMCVPEQFNFTDARPYPRVPGQKVSGLMDMTGGVVNTAHLKIGDGSVDVYDGGDGTINLSGDAVFNITVDGYQAFNENTPAGSLNISGDARFTMAGDKVQLLNDMITNGGLVNTTGRDPYFDGTKTIIGPGTLTLLTPNGGESLVAGSTYTITWQSQGTVSDVKIEYSANNGSGWAQVDPPNTGNSGSYDWVVPVVDSNQCLVRVSEVGLPSVNDTSDDVFTMFQCQGPIIGDLNGDCYVDWRDFGIFVGHWLQCGNPFDPACIN